VGAEAPERERADDHGRDDRPVAPPAEAPAPVGAPRAGAIPRLRWFSLVALAVVGATAVLPLLPDRSAPVPPTRALETMPRTLGAWEEAATPPGDVMPLDPDVTHHLYRTYGRGRDTVWLSVGYYSLLGSGRHPQAQRLVMPGQGYAELSVRSVDIPLGAGTLPANLVVMRAADRTLATLYWYHLGGRGVASDHGYRALLLWNRLWRHRSNVAVVRVVSPVSGGDADATVAAQADFVRALYPELRGSLPE
jgi:EpsI family protein